MGCEGLVLEADGQVSSRAAGPEIELPVRRQGVGSALGGGRQRSRRARRHERLLVPARWRVNSLRRRGARNMAVDPNVGFEHLGEAREAAYAEGLVDAGPGYWHAGNT